MLFPGQGSQTSDMRDTAERWCPELAARATQLVGSDPFDRVREGTRFAQPAIFCASVAGWRALEGSIEPDAVTGHSLGEIAALVAGGRLAADDALWLVVERGRLMHEAGTTGTPGGMAAMTGEAEQVETIRDGLDLVVANYNSPGQVVLSGPLVGVEAAVERGKELGVRVTRLPVSGAFHSPLMEPMLTRFEEVVENTPVHPGAGPTVFSSATCAPVEDVAATLIGGLTSPVRWQQTIEVLVGSGVETFVEAGPGRALTRMLAKDYGDRVRALAATELTSVAGGHA